MNDGMRGDMIRQIETLFNVGTVAGLSDGQLLERFAMRGDEAAELAFAALVERHGATVLRVCRGVLRDSHDAEDAFQATFLVLARKARSIRRCDSVGSWLYGVALRVSADARERAARRRLHERRAAQMSTHGTGSEADDDVRLVVQEEVGRLPERDRAAIILCDLEGRTGEDAARLLGWPLGTVRSRLARARHRLRGRLARRGLAPSLIPPAGIPVGRPWPDRVGDVPPALAEATVRAALPYSACRAAAAGTVPAAVAALTEGALRTMMIAKLKTTIAAAFLVGLALAGTSVLARHAPAPRVNLESAVSVGRPLGSGKGGPAAARGTQSPNIEGDGAALLLARTDPDVATDPLAGRSEVGSREPSLQELEILLAQSKRRLARYETLLKKANISHDEVEIVRTEVEILNARLEARREDLRDQLERLEARLLVKQAEEMAAFTRRAAASALRQSANTDAMRLEDIQGELGVKQAEVAEVKVLIKQVTRRLKRSNPDAASAPQPK